MERIQQKVESTFKEEPACIESRPVLRQQRPAQIVEHLEITV